MLVVSLYCHSNHSPRFTLRSSNLTGWYSPTTQPKSARSSTTMTAQVTRAPIFGLPCTQIYWIIQCHFALKSPINTCGFSILDWDFPWNKPSSSWGTTILGNPHIVPKNPIMKMVNFQQVLTFSGIRNAIFRTRKGVTSPFRRPAPPWPSHPRAASWRQPTPCEPVLPTLDFSVRTFWWICSW